MKHVLHFESLSLGNGPALDRPRTGHAPGLCKSLFTLLLFLFAGFGQMWGATTYTLIKSNASLSNGDKVVVVMSSTTPTNGSSNGVTGWNNDKDATVNTTEANWVQYTVGSASASGWTLYDETAKKYIASPTGNHFKYDNSGGTCSVNSDGVLVCNSRYLVKNGSYYRMYTSIGNYTPFYVWKVSAGTTPTITKSSSMTTLTYSNGNPVAQYFTVGGTNLTNNVTVTAPVNGKYEVSTSQNSGYGNSVELSKGNGTLANTNVYIRLKSGLAGGNISADNINITSTGATAQTISVSGSVPYTITWMANGSEHTTTYVAVGSTLALPATDPVPNTCGCTGKAFYGWYGGGTSYKNASVAPSIAAAGNTVNADKTYYAVFADASGGGSTTKWVLTALSAVTEGTYALMTGDYHAFNGTITSGKGGITTNAFSFTNGEATSAPTGTCEITFQAVTGGFKMYNSSNGYLYAKGSTSGNLGWHASESSYWKYYSSNWMYNNNSARLRSYDNGNFNTYGNNTGNLITLAKKTTVSNVTYSNYNTSCCTPLGTINGSISWSNPTTAVVEWNKLDEQVSAWALSWSPNTAGSSITSAIADKGETQKTATVSGLACGTQYTFTLTPTTKSGVCPVTDNPTIVSTSTKYAITSADNGEPTGGYFTTLESACNGDDVDLLAEAATGYTFNGWTITKASTGTVSPAANTAETTFTMPAEAVTVSAEFICVEPSIETQPASASYQQGATPAALSVAATLSSGTLTYLWKVSTNSGSTWSNASGTNNEATYAAANISTANTGTTKYKCIVGNQEGGCEVESNVATIEVTAPSKCLTPTFSVAAGPYYEDKSVELGCNTDGVTIYYTTNNTTPTTSSSVYSSAISVTQTTTIKAIAVKAGLIDSDVAEATYTIKCETPTIVLAAGNYTGVQTTTITKGYGTKIYYTTDGSTPSNTNGTEYTGAVSIDQPMTLKAIVWKDGCTNSEVASAAYTLKCTTPTFNNGTGTYTGAQSITLSGTAGADIYYTLDGTDPSKTHGTKYTAAIEVSANQTVKAIAVKEGWGDSEIASATYTIQYNVYWWVNGVEWTGKGGSTLVTYGQTATAPTTAPTKANGCGDKFMGWTTEQNYENDNTAPMDMFTETSAAITKETNFYAVFADYGEE